MTKSRVVPSKKKSASYRPNSKYKSIVSTVKEPISTKELLVRLQSLSDELSAVDQEKVDVAEYKTISADLVNKKLLGHINSGVQAYVCACISDILRINAPNAPYTASELSLVFKTFFKQFKRLSDPENPYFQQQSYLLKRLAEVRSAILITDLPDAEDLIQLVFDTFYDLSTTEFPTRLEPLAGDILSEVIGESETIPHDVLKLILNRFLTHVSEESAITAGLNSNIVNTGFNFSMTICEANLDRMARSVAQYFSEMLYESTNQPLPEDQENESINNNKKNLTKTLEKLEKIHKLSVQIWKFIPELLTSVMSFIDDELNADDEKIRSLATETIGQIIGSSPINSTTAKVNFFIAHKETWTNWLKKTTDVSPQVRIKWVQQFPSALNSINSSTREAITSLVNCLYKCLLDTDERVREAACISISKVSFPTFASKICNKNIMTTLTHLSREKNSKIRNQVISVFGNIYNDYFRALSSSEIIDFGNHDEEESSELERLIMDIPNQILSLIYINDRNITANVDFCIFDKLLPINEGSSVKRVERIAQFYQSLDSKGKESFIAINKRQQQVSKVAQAFIDLAGNDQRSHGQDEKENIRTSETDTSGAKAVTQSKLDKILKWICVSFPDGLNTYACLERFYKLKKSRYFYLLKICNSPESDYNTVRNSMKELLTKLSDHKNIKIENERGNISTKDMVTNIRLLLIRSSVLLYNKSNVVEWIKYSKSPKNKWYVAANEILEHISETVPDVFKFHIKALTDLVLNTSMTEDPTDSETNVPRTPQGLQLRVIYHFIKKYPDLFPTNIDFTESLKKIATCGSPREAKYSIKILNLSSSNQFYFSEVITQIYPLNLDDSNISTHLSTIAELFIVDPVAVQDKAGDLTSLLIKEVFLKNRSIDMNAVVKLSQKLTDKNQNEGEDQALIDDDTLDCHYKLHSTLYEKLLALRILVNRLIGLVKNRSPSEEERKEITDNAQPVLKLLISFIGNSGEIISKNSPGWPTPEIYRSKIRISAGLFLLKLAKYPIYSEMIHPTTLRRLSFLLNDANERVRSSFLFALQKNLADELVSERFLAIAFFSATESSTELKNNSIMWIRSLSKRHHSKKSIAFEKTIVRIIHMIANHEQFLGFLNTTGDSIDLEDSDERLIQAYSYALKFITFYISLVASQENISLLYYFASRVKQHRDATLDSSVYDSIPNSQSVLNIYRVSELVQFSLKEYSDHKGWPMQTWPGKFKLPADIYTPMLSSKEAQGIVSKVFIPESIQQVLKISIRKKLFAVGTKRKAGNDSTTEVKKPKISVSKPKSATHAMKKAIRPKVTKSSFKVTATPQEPSRKSSRSTKKISYVEDEIEDEDDEESDSEVSNDSDLD